MMKDYLKMSFSTIRNRSMRSWLTMIGIFVGIAAVVSLISVGQGMQTAIEAQFDKLGTDILIIQPQGAGFVNAGDNNPVQLTERDESIISKTKGVLETSAWVFRSEQINFKDDVNFQFVTGIEVDDPDKYKLTKRMLNFDLFDGRMLELGDKFKAVAGYSYTVKDEIFPQVLRVGDKLEIKGTKFDIVGIIEKTGSPPDDGQLIIPMDVADEILDIPGEKNEKVRDFIIAQVSPGLEPAKVAETMHRQLMNFRDLEEGEEDFQVQTADQLLGTFNTILLVVQAVLIGIAAISLLVGGIGIMNTMYTAVLERTREIGIMKAIGAKNSDIMLIFLIESGTLGLIGGLIGVVIGYGISAVITIAVKAALADTFIVTFFPWWLVFGALGFSFVVGALSGLLPAYQASKMNPVNALRYE